MRVLLHQDLSGNVAEVPQELERTYRKSSSENFSFSAFVPVPRAVRSMYKSTNCFINYPCYRCL